MKEFFLNLAMKYLKKKGFKVFKTTDGELSRVTKSPEPPVQGKWDAGQEGKEYIGMGISLPLPEGKRKVEP